MIRRIRLVRALGLTKRDLSLAVALGGWLFLFLFAGLALSWALLVGLSGDQIIEPYVEKAFLGAIIAGLVAVVAGAAYRHFDQKVKK